MRQEVQRLKYLTVDFISALAATILFDLFRYRYLAHEQFSSLSEFLIHMPVLGGLMIIPLFWLVVHYYSGYYRQPSFISRLREFTLTVKATLTGIMILFFVMVLNDPTTSFWVFYQLIGVHFALQFGFTYLFRLLITRQTIRLVHSGELGRNTLIIGTGSNALQLYNELNAMSRSMEYKIVGFVETPFDCRRVAHDKVMGTLDALAEAIDRYQIEELLIALDTENKEELFGVVNRLYPLFRPIRMMANRYDILMGSVHMDTIYGKPLVNITPEPMDASTTNIKRSVDIAVSLLLLLLFAPLMTGVALMLKLGDGGAVFYSQERVGLLGRKFTIHKFRTMCKDAEGKVPRLSSADDPRITPMGRLLRKYRIDELPQLYNVIKGEMSLIGPRPEREYFIERIVERAPYYPLLLTVRPGITSWGMVKFGYADSVEKMIERSVYDLIYLHNASLPVDAKIALYTLHTIITGKGV